MRPSVKQRDRYNNHNRHEQHILDARLQHEQEDRKGQRRQPTRDDITGEKYRQRMRSYSYINDDGESGVEDKPTQTRQETADDGKGNISHHAARARQTEQ